MPALVEALTDDDEVRGSAATALGLLGDREAVPALVARLDKEGEASVLGAILMALGNIGDPGGKLKVRDSIEPLLSDQNRAPEVRGAAGTALGLLGDRAAVAALVETLKDDDEDVRGAAMSGLLMIGSSGTDDEIIFNLAAVPVPGSSEFRQRSVDRTASRAVKFLSRYGTDERVIDILRNILRSDPSVVNRTEAVQGLVRCGGLDTDTIRCLIDPATAGPLPHRPNLRVDTDWNLRRECAILSFSSSRMVNALVEKNLMPCAAIFWIPREKGRQSKLRYQRLIDYPSKMASV